MGDPPFSDCLHAAQPEAQRQDGTLQLSEASLNGQDASFTTARGGYVPNSPDSSPSQTRGTKLPNQSLAYMVPCPSKGDSGSALGSSRGSRGGTSSASGRAREPVKDSGFSSGSGPWASEVGTAVEATVSTCTDNIKLPTKQLSRLSSYERMDCHTLLSAVPWAHGAPVGNADGVSEHGIDANKGQGGEVVGEESKAPSHNMTYPLPLLIFVALLAALCGCVVAALHTSIHFSGCLVAVNGCEKGYLIQWVDHVFDGRVPEELVIVFTTVLCAVWVWMLFSRLPEDLVFQIKGGGTVPSLVAVATGDPISFTAMFLRFIVTCVYLGAGGPLGAEGPAIQLCTATATMVGWSLRMRAPATQSLLASLGFASGFAASFNSPISGILFAMEELESVSSHMTRHMLVVIMLASVVATMVARAAHGNHQLLHPHLEQVDDSIFGENMWMLIAVPIGALSSLVGCCVIKGSRFAFYSLKKWKVHQLAALVGQAVITTCIGAVCYRYTGLRGIWGTGSLSMQQQFDRNLRVDQYLLFCLGKVAAMVVAVSVRAPGGFLFPTFLIGECLGGATGITLVHLGGFQDELADQIVDSCLIFGMVGVFASCFRFSLTPVVIALEITGIETYSLVLPTILCSFTAIACSNHLCPPLLHELMEQNGIDLDALHAYSKTAFCHDDKLACSDPDEGSQAESSGGSMEDSDLPTPCRHEMRTETPSSQGSSPGSALFASIEESVLKLAKTDHYRRNNSRSPSLCSSNASVAGLFVSAAGMQPSPSGMKWITWPGQAPVEPYSCSPANLSPRSLDPNGGTCKTSPRSKSPKAPRRIERRHSFDNVLRPPRNMIYNQSGDPERTQSFEVLCVGEHHKRVFTLAEPACANISDIVPGAIAIPLPRFAASSPLSPQATPGNTFSSYEHIVLVTTGDDTDGIQGVPTHSDDAGDSPSQDQSQGGSGLAHQIDEHEFPTPSMLSAST